MASSLVWSHTKAVRACNAPEIPPAEWEKHRELLKELYITQNKTLTEVKDHMRTRFGFSPSTRQYTRKFEHWQYFKNTSRHRHNCSKNNGPPPRGPSVGTPSGPNTLHEEARDDLLEEAFGSAQWAARTSTGKAQVATHVPVAEPSLSEACFADTGSTPLRHPSAGVHLAGLDQSYNEGSRQRTERMADDATPPGELSGRLVRPSHWEAPDPSMSWLLPDVEEDQSTPSLSIAVSTDESNSIETASHSSSGSGGVGVRMLMDVDDEAMTQLPIVRKESTCGTGVSLTGKIPSRYTTLAGIENQLPVLSEEAWTYRPSQLLLNPNSAKLKLFTDDLDQIREVADFFFAAQSSEDAFNLYCTIASQAMGHLCLGLATPLVLQAAIDITKSATTAANYADIARLIPDVDLRTLEVSAETSAKVFLLRSHLGNCYRALGRLGSAEHHCHVGLQAYLQLSEQLQHIGPKVTLLSNLELVLKDSRQPLTLEKSLNDIFPTDLTGGDLYRYIDSCSSTLKDGDFNNILRDADEALWDQAPTERDLANFEMTVLFCCFWAQWRAERQNTSWRRVRLAQFEKKTGIPPIETLSTLAILIMDPELSPFDCLGGSQRGRGARAMRKDLDRLKGLAENKHSFEQRAQVLCRNLPKLTATELFKNFLHAYASPLRTKGCRFSSETYAFRVQTFVRGFVDAHFLLNLSESAAEELRLWKGPGQPWLSPSFDPPMLPTPRSSYVSSGSFASFKATFRRDKQVNPNGSNDTQPPTANEKRSSTGSSILKRRWSQISSKLSLSSSTVNIKENGNEDSIMQDAF